MKDVKNKQKSAQFEQKNMRMLQPHGPHQSYICCPIAL